jgi:hypothetical protein
MAAIRGQWDAKVSSHRLPGAYRNATKVSNKLLTY